MTFDPLTSLSSISAELETSWRRFDEVYDTFTPQQWRKKFGKTWTYADQPWHQAYFDGTLAGFLAWGENIPAGEQFHLRSMGDLNDWNRREFAKRPPGQTVQDSLRAMRESRDAVRAQLATLSDATLSRRTWMPLIFGWTTARDVLQAIIVHNVAEYWKLWIRTGKRSSAPTPDAVHLRLGFMMQFMPATMNRELAKRTPFTVWWRFEGPGGGDWTFEVQNGECTVSERAPLGADVSFRMKPETFHKLVAKMTPPPVLMLTRQMKVKGMRSMGTFAKLFPEPRPDQIIEPSAGFAAG